MPGVLQRPPVALLALRLRRVPGAADSRGCAGALPQPPGGPRRADGAAEPRRTAGRCGAGRVGAPCGFVGEPRAGVRGPRPLQVDQRHAGARGRRRAASGPGVCAARGSSAWRPGLAGLGRRVRAVPSWHSRRRRSDHGGGARAGAADGRHRRDGAPCGRDGEHRDRAGATARPRRRHAAAAGRRGDVWRQAGGARQVAAVRRRCGRASAALLPHARGDRARTAARRLPDRRPAHRGAPDRCGGRPRGAGSPVRGRGAAAARGVPRGRACFGLSPSDRSVGAAGGAGGRRARAVGR